MLLSPLIRQIGGAFDRDPEELVRGASPAARRLLERAIAPFRGRLLFDYHVHVAGLGNSGSGLFINRRMQSWRHPLRHLAFQVYLSAAGVTDLEQADAQFVERVLRLMRGFPSPCRFCVLAFDKRYDSEGRVDLAHTEFFVPDRYVFALARQNPGLVAPVASVHPYRPDALAALDQAAAQGARLIKWLPNAMGIDPQDARIDPFYGRMKQLGLTLLTHAGDERAVEAAGDQALGNPLRLRCPLDQGVRVIIAHCASLGCGDDLDEPAAGTRENFELFLRLMAEPRYEGLLYADISALTQFNRLPGPLRTILEREDLQRRLVNGSDYPLPAIHALIRTGTLVRRGFLRDEERHALDEIYHYNPLLFDLVLKRTVHLPGSDRGLSPEIFTRDLTSTSQMRRLQVWSADDG